MNKTPEKSHLHALPVPCRIIDGFLFVESQAANGIRQWSEHFDSILIAMPHVPDQHVNPFFQWISFDDLELGDRVRIHPLPWGYGPAGHVKHCRAVAAFFREVIPQFRYLQFGISGCTLGDWPALGARVAGRMGRSYGVHTDWVTHQMDIPSDVHNLRRLRRAVEKKAMYHAEKSIIRGASLGLFHGADTYEVYREWCSNPQLIHDVHVSPSQLPSVSDIQRKCDRASKGCKLKVVYAGRAVEMKGPKYWLETIRKVLSAGIDVDAMWYGDGPEYNAMCQYVSQNQLGEYVTMPGMAEHTAIIRQLQQADVLMFCHVAPESPRILIESLNQGTPIVGFVGPYPADLSKDGGGILVPRGDTSALAKEIGNIDRNRQRLCELIREAAEAGRALTDEAVFKHRAELIKEHLK